ncbi:hypothetical protein BGX26_009732 [Mortierella sp. AD094]|nr:hypothetical protein BGX26_009732 [Mortierella sp. AD094]
MRLFPVTIVALSIAMASMSQAQDANCTAVYNDYSPSVNSHGGNGYQQCYTDQAYNAALVSQGATPNYRDVLNQVCGKPASCSHSTLVSATEIYMAACNASIDTEAANGNILQIGKNALEIFFAEPIRDIYCAQDPNAVELPPPAVTPPSYCLANAVVGAPNSRFITNLALYLTSGSIRASQSPFFSGLDPADTCSPCSLQVLNTTVSYLAENLMPRIGPFYTFEFIQYWTNLVPEYNTLCKTSIVQTWPKGTLNATLTGTPTGSPTLSQGTQSTVATPASATPIANNGNNNSNNGNDSKKTSDSYRVISLFSTCSLTLANKLVLGATSFGTLHLIADMFFYS